MKRIIKLSVSLMIVMLITAFTVGAYAIDTIDENQSVGLTINSPDGIVLKNIQYKMYLVAEMSGIGELTSTPEFAASGWEKAYDSNSDDWSGSLQILLDWLKKNPDIMPVDSALSDATGIATFPTTGKVLEKGVYLVTASESQQSGSKELPVPFLISLPYLDANENWVYKGNVTIKSVNTSVSVRVEWNDIGYSSMRPKSVYVSLVYGADKTVYNTTVFSAENEWKHTWTELSTGYDWNIKEQSIPDYSCEVIREQNGFVVRYTYMPNKLPQTGQLWWPIPILVISGLCIFTLGYIRFRRNDE